jgi:anhydro-N-acetylmuramic acid kinase
LKKNNYFVVGVMSGTSLDGIDLAYCNIFRSDNGLWNYHFIETHTYAYPEYWQTKLKDAIHNNKEELKIIDRDYTEYISKIILRFLDQRSIVTIDAICSHGHTIIHQPKKGVTLQIGNRAELAQLINQRIVCNFRIQDVHLGGQGAPLVPIGDQLLFSEFDYCLNLGGFANISHNISSNRIAYDICPVNIVLNYYAQKLGLEFDDEGIQAERGEVDQTLLDNLNDIGFYSQNPPKSLGLEWVLSTIFPLIDRVDIDIRDILRTYVEHIAIQLSSEIKMDRTVMITGGGAYNTFLINRVKKISGAKLVIPDDQLIDYKEALIFGLLGVLRLRNENNCLSSVTGAERDHCSGIIYNP